MLRTACFDTLQFRFQLVRSLGQSRTLFVATVIPEANTRRRTPLDLQQALPGYPEPESVLHLRALGRTFSEDWEVDVRR